LLYIYKPWKKIWTGSPQEQIPGSAPGFKMKLPLKIKIIACFSAANFNEKNISSNISWIITTILASIAKEILKKIG
jgi:hypothetical protein